MIMINDPAPTTASRTFIYNPLPVQTNLFYFYYINYTKQNDHLRDLATFII